MSRWVCFIDDDGMVASCLQNDDDINCAACEFNPFPDKVVPEDRVLHERSQKTEWEAGDNR